jgi:hypothetical protein
MHQRLVAHHMKARFDKRSRHRVMHMVGGDDAHEVDALTGRPAQFISQ